MNNAADQYDLITVLWRLDGFKGIGSEIGQSHLIEGGRACHRYGADGPFAKITYIAPTFGGAVTATIHDRVTALRDCGSFVEATTWCASEWIVSSRFAICRLPSSLF
jgi:hypothetical protein